MLPEMARVLDAIVSHRAGLLSCVKAGELAGLSERHFRRLRDAYEDRGEEGLVDRRRGRVSSSRVLDAEVEWLAEAFRTRYFGFRVKHFHEQIVGQAMLRRLVHATPTTGLSRGAQPRLHEEVEKSG